MTAQNGLLALVLAALAATLALELRSAGDEPVSVTAGLRPSPARAGAPAVPQAAPGEREEWVDTILARPLFSASRRPEQVAAKPVVAAAVASLPRVTGILVDGTARRAMFAAAGEGRPLVVGEGDQVQGLRVQSIEPGRVTLVGPEGRHELLPSFDPSPPPASPVAALGQPPSGPGFPAMPPTGPGQQPFSPFPGLNLPPPATAR